MVPSRTVVLIIAALAAVPLQVAASSVQSAEPGRLSLTETALEAILTRMLFNQEGRLYLKEPSDCNYAVLQKHSVELGRGLIGVRAILSWSAAKRLFGECRGLSTTFEVLVTAMPVAGRATLGLRDIQVSSPEDDVVAVAALALLRSKIPASYDVDVAQMLGEALASTEMTDLLIISDFQAIEAQVGDGTLDLGLSFTLTSRY